MFDPLDHPVISLFLIILLVIVAFFTIVFIIGGLGYFLTGSNNPYNYRYIDVNGNEGFAQWCSRDNDLNCYTDKGYVQVKEYHKND